MRRRPEERRRAQYEGLVKPTVDRLLDALPGHGRQLSLAGYSDLMTAAVIGLMAALKRFERGRGVSEQEFVQFGMERCVLELLLGPVSGDLGRLWEDPDGG